MDHLGTNIAGVIIVLGFLIFAHESGHFLVAKLFGVRVLVFSFGFGRRLFGFRKGDTDYRVSLIPLGGYVRMAGDSAEEHAPEGVLTGSPGDRPTGSADEFLSKPKWQRFLILAAGPVMNLIIAVAFLAGLSMIGLKQQIIPPVIGEVFPNMPAARAGLQMGDRIVRINGETIEDFDDLRLAISMRANTPLLVEFMRAGSLQTTTLTPERAQSEYGPIGRAGFTPMIEPVIGGVDPGSAAERAGLKAGDRIVGANGNRIVKIDDFVPVADKAHGAPIELEVLRGSQTLHLTLPAVTYDPDRITRGFLPRYRVLRLSFPDAVRASIKENRKMINYAFVTLGRLFRPEGSIKELSGLTTIARISGETLRRGWVEMAGLMAMISLQLGIMNLLPIPVLDGGHIFILLLEGIARRDFSIQVKERIQQLGFVFLVMLLIVVNFNDVLTNIMRKG